MEQNYGPEGIALIAAGLITVLPAMLLVLLGFVCLIASGGHPWLLTLLYWLYGIGFALMLWGSIRSVQASNAGRAFRGGRPFVKRP
jgi:cytochrome c biogenesis protein CcdA